MIKKQLTNRKVLVLMSVIIVVIGGLTAMVASLNEEIKLSNASDASYTSIDKHNFAFTIQNLIEQRASIPDIIQLLKKEKPHNAGEDPWWNMDWDYRKNITIDHTKVSETLTNFPVLVNLSGDSDLLTDAQESGNDIVFTDVFGNQLHHEIEYFNGDTGDLIAWVNVTLLSSSENTVLYMYYGNSTCASQENVEGVWNSEFVMVQHLNETFGTVIDSTSYGNDGAEYISPDSNMDISGKIAGAVKFDGSDDYIDCGHSSSLDLTKNLTVEVWLNFNDNTGTQRFIDKRDDDNGYLFQFWTPDSVQGLSLIHI